MKTRFNSLDVVAAIKDLQSLCGLRVSQIYDIDSKTYLLKLQQRDEKKVILIESGVRFHVTAFEWPKNVSPSGFCMKLRKHLNNKRLTSILQVGADRIVDFQFGSGEAACHLILELFDRGNFILTDADLTILNVLRPHSEGDRYRFAVREKYPVERAKQRLKIEHISQVEELIKNAVSGEPLKKILLPHIDYGPSLLEHLLVTNGLSKNSKWIKDIPDAQTLFNVLSEGEKIYKEISEDNPKGIIIQKKEKKVGDDVYSNQEFEPYHFKQHDSLPIRNMDTFISAVDEFFSKMETQKIDMKALQMENEALKKVERIRKDQSDRVAELHKKQETDRIKGELIKSNAELVEKVIFGLRQALASQMSWENIEHLIEDNKKLGDPVTSVIHKLNLWKNEVLISLRDPFDENEDSSEEIVAIDLGCSAFGNAKLYYDDKRSAASKEQRTMEVQEKALKSAEKKVVQVLRDVKTSANISKARKIYWFEKFYWFVSSENFLVLGGRDQQQNELIVKRYLRQGDVYVHADVHGASSVIIKNPSGTPLPPKTLNEAGTMAACYCSGWDAKIVPSVWWVYHDQVSKTAPTGEYLTTGSFMVRGQKNFLPPVQLAMGIGFLFKFEESSLVRHKDERRIKITDMIEQSEQAASLESLVEVEENPESSESIKVDTEDNDDEVDDLADEVADAEEAELEALAEGGAEKSDDQAVDESLSMPDLSKGDELDEDDSNVDQSSTSLNEGSSGGSPKLKRGQRSKLKKIQHKYKHQDEEEKMLRMSILQSAGGKKENRKDKKLMKKGKKIPQLPKDSKKAKPTQAAATADVIDEEESFAPSDFSMLEYMTGIPDPEDELLFALPVIAPYNTLLPYKYKVKIIPGITKRGKASSSTVEHCSRSKEATPLERDLIKHINEQQVARNLPGKVKIASVNFNKNKK